MFNLGRAKVATKIYVGDYQGRIIISNDKIAKIGVRIKVEGINTSETETISIGWGSQRLGWFIRTVGT